MVEERQEAELEEAKEKEEEKNKAAEEEVEEEEKEEEGIVLRYCRKYCQFPVLPSSAEIRQSMIYFGIIRHSVCMSVCLWYGVA